MLSDEGEADAISSLSSFPEKHDEGEIVPKPITRKSRTGSRLLSMTIPRLATFNRVPQTPEDDPLDVSRLERAETRLCLSLTGRAAREYSHQASWKWFCQYLERRAAPVWNTLIVLVLAEASPKTSFSGCAWKSALYTAVATIADALTADGETSLPSLVEKLRGLELLNTGVDELAIHMVFQMVGWISAIWDPLPNDFGSELKLVRTGIVCKRRRTGAIRSTKFRVTDTAYQNVRRVANRFGNLIPAPDLGLDDESWSGRDVEAAWITTAYLSFHSLEKLVNIKVHWTSTLAQHLEYDSRQKQLYVFRHPSICLLMYRDDCDTLLSRIFNCERVEAAEQGRYSTTYTPTFAAFLVEVLQSYQLIFGLHKGSRTAMARFLDAAYSEPTRSDAVDPLLRLLCTSDTKSLELKELYEELDMEHFDNYIPVGEFPFLAKKLLNLQKISMRHNPRTFRRLWQDRRNPTTWFALWAVTILGIGTLLCQILQLIFQIIQQSQPPRL